MLVMGRSHGSGSIYWNDIEKVWNQYLEREKAIAGQNRGYISGYILKLGKLDSTLLPSLRTLDRVKWENLLGMLVINCAVSICSY